MYLPETLCAWASHRNCARTLSIMYLPETLCAWASHRNCAKNPTIHTTALVHDSKQLADTRCYMWSSTHQHVPSIVVTWKQHPKKMTTAAAVVTAADDTANRIELSLQNLCWMLPPNSVVSPRTTSEELKRGDGMNRWTKLYTRNVRGSKPTMPCRREACRWGPKGAKTAYFEAKHVAKSEAEEENSSQYPQMVMVFFVSPNRWTALTRTCWWELCTQWCWWACVHGQRQDESMGWAPR